MLRKSALLFCIIGLVVSCKLFRKEHHWDEDVQIAADTTSVPTDSYDGEAWNGTNEILYKNYRGSSTKVWDLVHTELSLGFDFSERSARGSAELWLHPHWETTDSVVIDAKGMKIKDILEVDSPYAKTASQQHYSSPRWIYSDSQHLKIFLSKKYNRNQNLRLRIYYSAYPYASDSKGNDAISGDRGLYFINHDLADISRPRQIWSQGETESSSRWFPTLDAPNQKTTLKITLFVPDTMVTLSNGTMIQSIPSTEPGIRMDVWEQTQPHAPYLTMIAIGNWALIKDQWREKPVNYLVEKKYAPYARLIFGNTPKMIEFFSNYTGVDFPWDKYSQVVVRDFVSGAMENTSATVHMEQLQHTTREHLDNTYEDYISHELFHQWFGDLVTTESWSNITLNESFATYGEYLWRDYYYGRTDAENLLQELREEYHFAGQGSGKQLVRYSYENEGELFDNISYQKGGCILHMLRYAVGETAFREGLKQYLSKYRFQSAEVANLRMVFEDITGQDLNWFFNQWYFDSDHPEIQLGIEKSDDESTFRLRMEQIQTHRNCYAFPVKIKWSVSDTIYEKKIFVDSRVELLDLQTTVAPDWYLFDADNALLFDATIASTDLAECAANIAMLSRAYDQNISEGCKFRLFDLACDIADRNDEGTDNDMLTAVMRPFCKKALRSSFNYTAQKVLSFTVIHPWYLDFSNDPSYHQITSVLENNKLSSDTRITALNKLYYLGYSDSTMLAFTNDSSIAVSLFAISRLRDKNGWVSHAKLEALYNNSGKIAVAWMRKLILASEYTFAEGLSQLANNPAVEPEDFDQALNSMFFYCPEGEIISTTKSLIEKLKKSDKKIHLQILEFRLKEEIKKLDKNLASYQPENPEDAYARNLQKLKDGYQELVQFIQQTP